MFILDYILANRIIDLKQVVGVFVASSDLIEMEGTVTQVFQAEILKWKQSKGRK